MRDVISSSNSDGAGKNEHRDGDSTNDRNNSHVVEFGFDEDAIHVDAKFV